MHAGPDGQLHGRRRKRRATGDEQRVIYQRQRQHVHGRLRLPDRALSDPRLARRHHDLPARDDDADRNATLHRATAVRGRPGTVGPARAPPRFRRRATARRYGHSTWTGECRAGGGRLVILRPAQSWQAAASHLRTANPPSAGTAFLRFGADEYAVTGPRSFTPPRLRHDPASPSLGYADCHGGEGREAGRPAVTPCGSNSAPSTCLAPPQFPANYLGTLIPWTGQISLLTTTGTPIVPQGGLVFVPHDVHGNRD